MSKETTQQGASGLPAETPKMKAFPTDTGELDRQVDNASGKGDDTHDEPMSPRDEVLANIDSRIDEERFADIDAQTREFQEGIDQGDEGQEGHVDETGEEREGQEDDTATEGLVSSDEQADDEYDDPLADYIVMDGETPMFVMKVDGTDRYMPVEEARRQLQKHTAAEVRLATAAERQKQLDEREAQILAKEQALAAKPQSQQQEASPSDLPDVSDQDLQTEAQKFVQGLYKGTEDDAVDALATLLGKAARRGGPSSAPVDPAQLVQQATQAVRAELTQEQTEKDIKEGYTRFKTDYPEIESDPTLFGHADNVMIPQIEKEWSDEGRSFTPSQVMTEAGKRTREWAAELAGVSVDEWVNARQSKASGSKETRPGKPANNDRQTRKRRLRPMPRPGSQRTQTPAQQVEPPQTPQDAVAEMRKARGQA